VRYAGSRAEERRDEGPFQSKEICLGHSELKVENVEELALDPADIPGAEHPCGERPLRVFQRSVVMVLHESTDPVRHSTPPKLTMKRTNLGSAHESTQKHPFKGPLGLGDGDVRFRPSDVDRGAEESGHRTLGPTDDGVNEMPELEVGVVPVGQPTTLRRGAMTQAVVDYVDGGVDKVVYDAPREREIDETDEPGLRGGGVHRSRGGGVWGGTMRYTGARSL